MANSIVAYFSVSHDYDSPCTLVELRNHHIESRWWSRIESSEGYQFPVMNLPRKGCVTADFLHEEKQMSETIHPVKMNSIFFVSDGYK